MFSNVTESNYSKARAAHIRDCQFYGDNDHAQRAALVEAAHVEALAMNAELEKEFASIDKHVPTEGAKPVFKAIASKYIVGCVMGVSAAHDEALKIAEAMKATTELKVFWLDEAIELEHQEALKLNDCFDAWRAMATHDIERIRLRASFWKAKGLIGAVVQSTAMGVAHISPDAPNAMRRLLRS